MEYINVMLDTVPAWFIWLITVGTVVYWYVAKRYSHWKHVGIPYVSAVPIFGSSLGLFKEAMHDVEVERYRKKGRIYGLYEGNNPALSVGNPDILRDIFVKDFSFFPKRRRGAVGVPLTDHMVNRMYGEEWKRVRSVLMPAFSTAKIKKMISIFTDSGNNFTNNLKAGAKEGKPVDVKGLFGAFTMDVIASSAFATKIDSFNDPDNPFVTAAKNVFRTSLPWRNALYIAFPWVVKIFKISTYPPDSLHFFEKVTLQIIEERKRTKQRRNDYLQLLLDAVERGKTEEGDLNENQELTEMGHEEDNEKIFKSYSKALSTVELVANCIIFFIAGYDTTALTLTFTAYELAVNPDVQDRLITEIDKVINEKGELNYEALCEMKYLDNVISEALRKYPPLFRNDRVAAEDYEIMTQDVKIAVPKGMIISIPVYAMHHDADHYPDPEKFDPDRFSYEQKSKRHPYAYLPFGAGPKNCIGMRFALLEMKACLAGFLSHCRFSVCSETQVPLQFMRGQRLLQPKNVILRVETRNDTKK